MGTWTEGPSIGLLAKVVYSVGAVVTDFGPPHEDAFDDSLCLEFRFQSSSSSVSENSPRSYSGLRTGDVSTAFRSSRACCQSLSWFRFSNRRWNCGSSETDRLRVRTFSSAVDS